jgi:hypothetical protein
MKTIINSTSKIYLKSAKKAFAFSILFVFLFNTLSAQLKINSSGNIGIGGLEPSDSYNLYGSTAKFTRVGIGVNPNTSYDLYCGSSRINYLGVNMSFNTSYSLIVSGSVRIDNNSYPGLVFGNTYYAKALYPTTDNKCQLGLSTNSFQYVYSYQYITTSDKRKKENIVNITNSLDLILKMQGVKYDLKKDNVYSDSLLNKDIAFKNKLEKDRKGKTGFIAQDLEKILPETVVYDDSSDIFGINYIEIIPYLVEAIKEQQKQIEELKLYSSIKFKGANENIENSIATSSQLGSCKPNPFNELATIEYYIPSEVISATLYIYDLQGKQIKSFNVSTREYGNIIITANEFLPGMYKYALITDGQLVDTKTMILTEKE